MDTIEEQNQCFNNLCNEKGLKVCTRCKAAWYCSKECQIRHWRTHKKCCKMISSSTEMKLRYLEAIEDYNAAIKQREGGEDDKALLSFQQLIEIFNEFQDDEYIAWCYYSIGRVLNSQNKYEEALVNLQKALEINKEIHGENHGRTCDCYESIGTVLGAQGRYDDALIGYGKALGIRMKIFGENHIDTARSYYHIGLNQLQKCDCDGALNSLQKSNTIYTRELGEEHELTVYTNDLINYCKQCIDIEASKPL